ncbi:MAG: DAK2 domain-containing protein, partial [Acidimicrobiia bacterium]
MVTLERLAALDLRQAITRFRDALRVHQDELNRLNVYPVPDGDTGTNMTLTLESVVNELATAEDMTEVCQAVAHGSLMGARGNSGVILSQVLRGLADTFRNLEAAGGPDFTVGLRRASDAA